MPKNRKQKPRDKDREGLEAHLLYLFQAYRPLFAICAVLLLAYATYIISYSPLATIFSLAVALPLALLSFSFQASLFLAKFGAWLGTIGRRQPPD